MVAAEYIKCPDCGIKFTEEDTEYCHRCNQMICPKCGACGCNSIMAHRIKAWEVNGK